MPAAEPRLAPPPPRKDVGISSVPLRRFVSPERFTELAQRKLDGLADADELAILAAYPEDHQLGLEQLLHDLDGVLRKLRATVHGPWRPIVLGDYEDEQRRIKEELTELRAPQPGTPAAPSRAATSATPRQRDVPPVAQPAQLQMSWADGRLVAWSAGWGTTPEDTEQVLARLAAAHGPTRPWTAHDDLVLPDGTTAPALVARAYDCLGWLVSLGGDEERVTLGTSVRWLAQAARLAVRLTAKGRMVPQLEKSPEAGTKGKGGRQDYVVAWAPALIDRDQLADLTRAMPGSVALLRGAPDPRAFTRSVVGGFMDIICREAARRIEVPEPPPRPRSAADVAETFLARLGGASFDAPTQHGNELSRSLQRWARGVTAPARQRLVVQLDPPDDGNAWHLRALAEDGNGNLAGVDDLLQSASNARRQAISRELDRLQRLYPIQRATGRRRGEVILSQDEAWELMTSTGPVLVAAGFDVRVPPLSRRKARPALRLTSEGSQESVVGANQLTAVSWSATFDDVELTAEELDRLSRENRPLVRSHGRWIEVDKADLEAARVALEERANAKSLTGADMLRLALGLEDSGLSGGVTIAGRSWAADLLRSANDIPSNPPTQPEGFHGELRSYQADALAWLDFLEAAGLGGCLALDMGLGKTPTALASLRRGREAGRGLVIAPPAVVGNWAAEAKKFVPDLRVLVHHGQHRAEPHEIARAIDEVDLVITTYGTALRDIDALAELRWGKVVLDEAQVIKNHTSETAQQLRRLDSSTRVVLTGTPIENGLGDLWSLMDFVNPGLLGERASFIAQLSKTTEGKSTAEQALRTLNGVLVFRRTKMEPAIAAELPDRIDELQHCAMTTEQIGLYQAVLDELVVQTSGDDGAPKKKGAVLAAITALKQICNHPENYLREDGELDGRSGKLARLNEIVDNVFDSGERMLIFTHFASWGEKMAEHLTRRTGVAVDCYHGGLARGARDRMIETFQNGEGAGALVLSLKAGGTGLNLTAANHVVLYDRWWNPAVEDQARDRAWRIGQSKTVICHRLICPGTVDERVEEVVEGKRRIANMVLPQSSSVGDLDGDQLRTALGIDTSLLLVEEDELTDTGQPSTGLVGAGA